MVMTTNKIASFVSSIEIVKKIIQKRNGVVSGVVFTNFLECLQGLELYFKTHRVSTLESTVDGLFEVVSIQILRNITITDQKLMYILVLLIVNKTAKAFAPRAIKHWIIFHVCMFFFKKKIPEKY